MLNFRRQRSASGSVPAPAPQQGSGSPLAPAAVPGEAPHFAGPARAPFYLVSMASYPNFGDELIARRWLEYLARHRPDDEVWLDGRHPGTATALFAGIHPRLRVTDAVFRTVEDALRGSRRSVEDIVTELGTPLYDAPLLALREAQSLHLLGGGFVNAVWPENDLIVRTVRAASRVSGAPLIATGQGFAPFGQETLGGFDHVSVRDTRVRICWGSPAASTTPISSTTCRHMNVPHRRSWCCASSRMRSTPVPSSGCSTTCAGLWRPREFRGSAPGMWRLCPAVTMRAMTAFGTWWRRTALSPSHSSGAVSSRPPRISSGSQPDSITIWSPRSTGPVESR